MCGIAGIFAYDDRAPGADREELVRIRDAMARRGPDGHGEWTSPDGRISLGHRRLAIIDLSPDGVQPMFSSDRRRVIVFNGEIYNYKTLRAELEAKGRRFRTKSDTEVILELIDAEGDQGVARLRGMFALALYDVDRRSLLLARDPFGIKPLYFADDGRVLRFASQVKALRHGGEIASDPDPAAIAGFFLWGSVPEPRTLYRSVRQLRAGHVMRVDQGGAASPRSYFSIPRLFLAGGAQSPSGFPAPDVARSPTEGSREDLARAAFLDSVRHHLVADVEVGAFLSAGIDSGAIVSLASEAAQRPLRTVTLAFEEFRGSDLDEAPLAEETARRLGTRHETRTISRRRFLDEIPRILDAMDLPTVDGVNSYFVSQVTAEAGLKVALSGLGGDELLGGYPTFKDLPWLVRGAALPSRIPGLGRAARPLLSALGAKVPPRYAEVLEFGGSWAGAYRLRRGLFGAWELPEILGADLAHAGLHELGAEREVAEALDPDPGTAFARVATLEASLYMRNQLLRDADWASMAHSLEVRVPLVDPWLWKSLTEIVGAAGQGRGKPLLAAAPRPPLPDEQVNRPKSGFIVPVWEWANGSPSLDQWRRVPALQGPGFQGPRRWAYTVFGIQAGELVPGLRR